MSTHNIGFHEDLIKIMFELSSNTHHISSAAWTKGNLEIPMIIWGCGLKVKIQYNFKIRFFDYLSHETNLGK